ncbi:metallophosphoesterase [Mesorhizobium calcicola]|uniref:Metallophosphoesterase n=1 Tax=Mesorhizobium calcicola TaxID=1300310 RepID=A0ABW4W7E4_9HYPH
MRIHAGGVAKGLIVTGDIAYAGKPEEYAVAAKWLDRLASAVRCPRTAVKLVPGNHDIDRDRISAGCTYLINEILTGGETKLDEFLADADDCKALYNRFVGYEPFALETYCPLHPGGGIASDSSEELAPGRYIRFFGLNSALICSKRKDEEGKLILGAAQRVLPMDPGVELVVLCHHPLHCLQDSVDARKYVRNRARVFISGHEHKPDLQIETIEDGCDLMMLASGATVPPKVENGYTYTYNLLTFDWCSKEDKLSVEVVPRAWNDDKKRFEADDVRLGGHKPRNLLASPNFRRGAPPVVAVQAEPAVQLVPDALHPALERREDLPAGYVAAPEPAPSQSAPVAAMNDAAFQLVLLKFFRDLTAAQRLKVLIDLDALPDDWNEELTLMMERNLIEDLVKDGRLDANKSSIERNQH